MNTKNCPLEKNSLGSVDMPFVPSAAAQSMNDWGMREICILQPIQELVIFFALLNTPPPNSLPVASLLSHYSFPLHILGSLLSARY